VDVLSDGGGLPVASLPVGHGAGGGNGRGTSDPVDSRVPPQAGVGLAMLAGSG